MSERCQNRWIKTSLLSQVASLSAKTSFQSCRNTAHLLSAPLIKNRMLTRLNWSQPDGIYVRSVGQLAPPDLNNFPKMPLWRDPILAAWPGCSWPGCMEQLSPGANRLKPCRIKLMHWEVTSGEKRKAWEMMLIFSLQIITIICITLHVCMYLKNTH